MRRNAHRLVNDRFDPGVTEELVIEAGAEKLAAAPDLLVDAGVENMNRGVDGLVERGLLRLVLAMVDISFSKPRSTTDGSRILRSKARRPARRTSARARTSLTSLQRRGRRPERGGRRRTGRCGAPCARDALTAEPADAQGVQRGPRDVDHDPRRGALDRPPVATPSRRQRTQGCTRGGIGIVRRTSSVTSTRRPLPEGRGAEQREHDERGALRSAAVKGAGPRAVAGSPLEPVGRGAVCA